MKASDPYRKPFIFVAVVTITAMALIVSNVLLNQRIPFAVEFLIGFIGLLLVFTIWHSILTKGAFKSLIMFSVSFIIAFSAEALGVNFGLIFGNYHYTRALGAQFLGVPFLAALAWEPILYAAFTLTSMLAPFESSWTGGERLPAYLWLAGVGALATTAWDMMIDPIAVSQGWWVWKNGGAYLPYVASGVPISNFMGWIGVSFVIQLFYRFVAGDDLVSPSPYLNIYGPLSLYASLFLTSFGVALTVLKRPEVALVGLLAMGPFLAIGLTNLNLNLYRQKAVSNASLPAAGIKTKQSTR